jgi:hypothetical protein
VLEEGHDNNIPSTSRGILEWIEALLYRVAKRALMRHELRILSDHHQWDDIIPPTPPARDV